MLTASLARLLWSATWIINYIHYVKGYGFEEEVDSKFLRPLVFFLFLLLGSLSFFVLLLILGSSFFFIKQASKPVLEKSVVLLV